MTDDTLNAIFVMNYSNNSGGHDWSNLPDDLWWRLVASLRILLVDGIGFQNISYWDQLPTHLASRLKSKPKCTGTYQPYHANSISEVAVFELTESVQKFLLSQHFDQWNRTNERLPFDELCLFRGNKILTQVVPYENVLLFYSLSVDDLHALNTIDARFRSGLYHTDLHALVSFLL